MKNFIEVYWMKIHVKFGRPWLYGNRQENLKIFSILLSFAAMATRTSSGISNKGPYRIISGNFHEKLKVTFRKKLKHNRIICK